MTVKAIVDSLRSAGGYSGLAVFAGGQELFSEDISREYSIVLLRLLRSSAGARRVSVAARGYTFTGFYLGDYAILLKLAGRFPAVPSLSLPEPEYVDPSVVPSLQSRETARQEAEAALRQFGLLDR